MKWVSLGLCLLMSFRSSGVAAEAEAVPRPRMNILVLEGEGSINNIRRPQGRDIAVQVRDGNRRPLAGAVVVFTLPEQGPGGHFLNGSKILTMTADEQGRAVARSLKTNNVPGKFEIRVNASRGEEKASVTVTQFNMLVPKEHGGSGKWIALAA